MLRVPTVPLLIALLLPATGPGEGLARAASRTELLAGPVAARVLEVTDGDTLRVEATVWPGQTVRVHVRLRGIDAPERRGGCAAERAAARRAREALAALVADGRVNLLAIGGGKYYGRVLAEVRTRDGADVGRRLLEDGLVRPYGGERRRPWCGWP